MSSESTHWKPEAIHNCFKPGTRVQLKTRPSPDYPIIGLGRVYELRTLNGAPHPVGVTWDSDPKNLIWWYSPDELYILHSPLEGVVDGELVREARYMGTYHKLECMVCTYVWEFEGELWTGALVLCPLCEVRIKVNLDG